MNFALCKNNFYLKAIESELLILFLLYFHFFQNEQINFICSIIQYASAVMIVVTKKLSIIYGYFGRNTIFMDFKVFKHDHAVRYQRTHIIIYKEYSYHYCGRSRRRTRAHNIYNARNIL